MRSTPGPGCPPAGIRITGAILGALQTVPGVVGADPEGRWRADPISLWDGSKGGLLSISPSMDDDYLPPVIGTQDITAYQGKGSGVTIAILDTGLRREDQAQFGSRLRPGVNSVVADRVTSAGTEDGFKDSRLDVQEVGHGSVVARMAAGPQDVAREAEVWPLKVCDDEGFCRTSSVLVGLCTALAEVPPKRLVLNMSMGGNVPNGGILRTLQAATARGALVVASVGNEDELASVGRVQSR